MNLCGPSSSLNVPSLIHIFASQERNLTVYYINGLKQIGSVLPPLDDEEDAPPSFPKPSMWSLVLTTAMAMTVSLGLIASLAAAFYYGPSGPGGKRA